MLKRTIYGEMFACNKRNGYIIKKLQAIEAKNCPEKTHTRHRGNMFNIQT